MQKVTLLLLLCSCFLCACKKNKVSESATSLEGLTFTINAQFSSGPWKDQWHFFSSSDCISSVWDNYHFHYSYSKNGFIISYGSEGVDVFAALYCLEKTKSKSSLDGTKWEAIVHDVYFDIEFNSTTFKADSYRASFKGTYTYNGETLTLIIPEESSVIEANIGNILYNMSAK